MVFQTLRALKAPATVTAHHPTFQFTVVSALATIASIDAVVSGGLIVTFQARRTEIAPTKEGWHCDNDVVMSIMKEESQ